MKKFKFTLSTLLDVKIALEKQQKSELAAAMARREGFVRGLLEMENRLNKQRAEYAVAGGPSIRSGELALRGLGFRALFFNMDVQKDKIRVAELEGERIRFTLKGTMNERKILEKLREKQKQRHKEELTREENAAMDEFLSNQLITAIGRR